MKLASGRYLSVLTVLLVFGCGFVFVWPTPYLYDTPVPGVPSTVRRINRFTGDVQILVGTKWVRPGSEQQMMPEELERNRHARLLDANSLSKLRVEVEDLVGELGGKMRLRVYNGTLAAIDGIDLRIKVRITAFQDGQPTGLGGLYFRVNNPQDEPEPPFFPTTLPLDVSNALRQEGFSQDWRSLRIAPYSWGVLDTTVSNMTNAVMDGGRSAIPMRYLEVIIEGATIARSEE